MSAKSSTLTNKVIAAILACAKDLNITPAQVKLSNLMAKDYGITEWDIRKLGGIDLVKKSNFPFEEFELGEINKSKKERTYIAKLERAVGEKIAYEEMLSDHFAKLEFPKLSKPKLKPHPTVENRHVIVSLNDVHFGAIIDSEEIGGVNNYGWVEASRRTAFLADQVVQYKIQHRDEVECLHVIFNGDMLQGIIHDLTARNSDLLALQQNGAIHILANFLNYVKQFYPKMEVYATTGNHENMLHRREGGHRVSTHIYDSHVTPVYYALSLMFHNDPTVNFNLSKGLYVDCMLPAGRLLITHGDILFSKQLGNPGTAINVKNLGEAISKFNAGEISRGKPRVKMILFGHTHVQANFTTFDGVQVYIAPSMSGIDNFAASLALNHNNVGQVIWESTQNYIFSDARLVDLLKADNDKSLDKIVPVYNRGLAWQKR
jgi:hypothetical protein